MTRFTVILKTCRKESGGFYHSVKEIIIMTTGDGWEVSFARVPLGSYMTPQLRKVRTRGGMIFQVFYERSLPLPCGESFDDWVKEMTDVIGTMEDVTVDYENANEEYGTELNAHGWANATIEQISVLKEHKFS
jgi:hypothetical protein